MLVVLWLPACLCMYCTCVFCCTRAYMGTFWPAEAVERLDASSRGSQSTKLWRWRRLLTWGNVAIHGHPTVAMSHISCCCCAIVFQTGSSELAFSYFIFLFQGKLVRVRLGYLASGRLYFVFFLYGL